MIDGIKKLFEWLYGILKPFDVTRYIDALKEPVSEYIGWINWLVPFGDILAIYTAWLACVGAYFVFVTVRPFVMDIIKRIFKKGE